jgi:thiol-disulfide isomerase/thioredoxin
MRAPALVTLVALVLAGCAAPATEAPSAWSLMTIEGDTITDTSPARNATVLFFMATWCGSCRAKAPVLAEAHGSYASRGVATYSVGFDPSESAEEIRAWQERFDQPWPHGLDADRSLQRGFGVRTQSTVLVLDRDGEVVRAFGYGEVTGAALREALDAALA